MKANVGAIDQELPTDMTNVKSSTDALGNEAMTRQRKARSVAVVLRPDHVVHGKSSGSHRQCTARLGHGGVATSLDAYFLKNKARLVVMMLDVLAFPLESNDVVNSLETMERKIKEFERYADIEVPEFLKNCIVIRQAEEGPMRTHLIMKIAHDFPGQQDRSDNVKQAQNAVMAKTGGARERGCVHEGVVQW